MRRRRIRRAKVHPVNPLDGAIGIRGGCDGGQFERSFGQPANRIGSGLPLPSVTRRSRLRDVRDNLGSGEWPKDVLRHSCATCRMASSWDAPRVAAEFRNLVDIPVRHYRELVQREDRQRFWGLVHCVFGRNCPMRINIGFTATSRSHSRLEKRPSHPWIEYHRNVGAGT